ncbi:MAG: isocitrate lyase/phosphoenolpyruvate mutase family protein [Bradyrhizobiaceae bacterium]|jgi:methylisocitrate lyase|nr:MAG: isocitrate lyase/phosphoenolpyruvate mutase family protein [Bradyrhizobiaceae bacterium]
MPVSTAQKRADFRKLHESGCFVLPNPWDVGSALLLQGMGFKALASTSSGLAWSIGHSDNNVNRDHVLAHLKTLCDATDLPVNADFEAGFAHDPAVVAANVARGVDTGVAGLSIEDSTGDVSAPLYEMTLAVERMRAARAAIDAKGGDIVLVGRCESFLVGQPDLKATIARLVAYAEAGADCLYAPGIRTREQIAAVVKELAPKPINVLMGGPGLTVAELTDLGVRRISIGGALARAAWGGFLRAAREIAEKGSFSELAHAVTHAEINGFFIKVAKDRK